MKHYSLHKVDEKSESTVVKFINLILVFSVIQSIHDKKV